MLYICNVCSIAHTSLKKARKCAIKCVAKKEGHVFKSGYSFYCPICERYFETKKKARKCMFECYVLKYDNPPFDVINHDGSGFPLCALCTHSDENKKTYLPCPQHVFCDEMKNKCVIFEPDIRTFGTKLSTDFRLYHLGAEG